MNRTDLDYYNVLNIPRSATHEEITLKYRQLAIRLCPFRDNRHDQDFVPPEYYAELTHLKSLPLNRQWEYINMAYDVLGNKMYRAVYDRYGEAGLFQGILLPNGYFHPYQYDGDHMRVYNEVFGSYSPYANIIDAVTNPPVLYSTRNEGIGVRKKDEPVEKVIPLELEEVRFGCVKLMHVWRQEFVDAKKTRTEKRKKSLTLEISPGTAAGTQYVFTEEGDQSPNKTPADIIFTTADKPHKRFERRNDHDLVYKYQIDICQALIGFQINVETLDKRNLKISITDVVNPGFEKRIPGEGLPKCVIASGTAQLNPKQAIKEFGDLIILFDINFPKVLSKEMKIECKAFSDYLRGAELEALKGINSPTQKDLKEKK